MASKESERDYGTEGEHEKIVVDRGDAEPATKYEGAESTQDRAVMSVRRVRLTYGALLIIGFVLGIILKTEVFTWIAHWAIDRKKNCDETCVGNQSVYRVSFALAAFFFVHWALSSSWNLCMNASTRISFNQQGIFWKLLSLIPFILVSFAIPNEFFVVFAWFCVVLSVIFLIGQLVILLEFSYTWSDDWASREEQKFTVGLIVCTAVLTILSLVFIGLSYAWFGSHSECQTAQGMISTTLVAGVFYFAASIAAPHGSLMPSATVFAYTTFTCFSALAMSPPGPCNTHGTNGTTTLVISTIFSAISLVYMTVSAGESRSAFQISEVEETEEEAEASSFSFFHLQMMLGSCYLAMLLTNWTVDKSGTTLSGMQGSSAAPQWAKFTSELVCILFYCWTLLAPIVFPDRSFS